MLESKEILSLAKFNLRGWVHTGVSEAEKGTLLEEEKKVPVLGLIWKPDKDTLSVNWEENSKINEIPVTKRKILSAVHRIFDPIGFTCPVTLEPKILLQECWKLGVSWDTELPLSISRKFERWKEHLKCLNNLEIPRCISKELSLTVIYHCMYLRCKTGECTYLLLVGLCKCSLLDKAQRKLGHLCEQQGTRNTSIDQPEDWKHIPGILNPADLPSRGCGVVELIASLWWEGPSWLNKPREEWPLSEACPDRATIDSERKRTVASTINHEPKEMDYLSEISSFKKIIRVTAWIYRFYHNLRKQRNDRDFGELITQETDAAERKVLKIVQKQSFSNDTKSLVSQMQTLVDSDGIIRIKSKIIMRKDVESIRYPIVLPSRHPIVTKLIIQKHIELLYAGVQTVMSALRENYWILKSRKTVRRVLSECIICKRFTVRPLTTLSPPLPEDRVREAQILK
ncbi:integrase catalytic domain-containing protein [Trichonephila clavipes]|nr:integrase catalytic domain-containing protein [Trichonephila clavipes]